MKPYTRWNLIQKKATTSNVSPLTTWNRWLNHGQQHAEEQHARCVELKRESSSGRWQHVYCHRLTPFWAGFGFVRLWQNMSSTKVNVVKPAVMHALLKKKTAPWWYLEEYHTIQKYVIILFCFTSNAAQVFQLELLHCCCQGCLEHLVSRLRVAQIHRIREIFVGRFTIAKLGFTYNSSKMIMSSYMVYSNKVGE